jgi:serine/threonine protein kinase
MGSGLLAQQPTPSSEAPIAVAKVCPQCGTEYETVDRFCPRDGSPLRPKAGSDPLVGRVIAERYLIIAKLGEGGMGRVYLAEHVKMNRQCAIKVMNPSLVNDPESSARFAREASNAARIIHPNVAAVFDFGEADKIVYLVMEYVDGESLSAALARDGTFEPRRAIDIARQIADGLAAAHELGIVHRDLKPDNVIVARSRSGRETPKVVDFGIAKAASEAPQDALTKSGLVIGTPEYMSPEQLLGDPVDERTDVYALGCILYQMITGASPFAADSREQMIRRRLHEPPPHIREVDGELPRRLDTLIAHMLARSPSERLSSAAAVRDALDPGLVFAGWTADSAQRSAERRRLTTRNAPTVTGPPADPSLQPTIPLSVARRRSFMRIFGGSLVGSAAILILLLWSQHAGRNPPEARSAAGIAAPDSMQRARHAQDSVIAQLAADSARRDSLQKDSVARLAAAKHETAGKSRANGATTGLALSQAGAKGASTQRQGASDTASQSSPTPAMRPEERAARTVLEEFTSAVKSANMDAVGVKFTNITPGLREYFRDLFAKASSISTHTVIGEAVIMSSDQVSIPYSLDLTFTTKGTGQRTRVPLSYTAIIRKQNGKWAIASLETRRTE